MTSSSTLTPQHKPGAGPTCSSNLAHNRLQWSRVAGLEVASLVAARPCTAKSALKEVREPIARPNIRSPSSQIWKEPAPESQEMISGVGVDWVCRSAYAAEAVR